MNRQAWCGLTVAVCLAACGGSQPPAAAIAEPATAPDTAGQADAVPDAAPDAAPAAAATLDDLRLDFSSSAVDYMQRHAATVPDEARRFADALIQQDADAERCSRYEEAERVFLVDVDGDRQHELLAIYTLEGCGGGGGNDYHRGVKVAREIDGRWQEVLWAPLGSKLTGSRTIAAIGDGSLTLAGNADEPGNLHQQPETVRIPAMPK